MFQLGCFLFGFRGIESVSLVVQWYISKRVYQSRLYLSFPILRSYSLVEPTHPASRHTRIVKAHHRRITGTGEGFEDGGGLGVSDDSDHAVTQPPTA